MFNFQKQEKKEPKNLKEALSEIKDLRKDIEKLFEEVELLKKEAQFSVKKVGLIRFNPFREVGGDQSFSLALLNAEDTGVVITSLYTREENRIYGKPVKKGKSEYQFSKEEEKAILKAKSQANEKEEEKR